MDANVTEEVKYPVVAPTEFRENLEYSRDYVLIANSVALGFIPILTLIVLNSCIFRTISKATQRHNAISSNQRRDHSVSRFLSLIWFCWKNTYAKNTFLTKYIFDKIHQIPNQDSKIYFVRHFRWLWCSSSLWLYFVSAIVFAVFWIHTNVSNLLCMANFKIGQDGSKCWCMSTISL